MEPRPALSAVLITYNTAEQLAPCLASLGFANEILIVDSGSSDATLEIARSFGAHTLHRTWSGFGAQKRFAVEQARFDWVLCIDADERVPAELARDIQAELAAPQRYAYEMPRSNFFMGRYLRHGEGYPDWSLRLFHRGHAQWSDDAVHEKVTCDSTVGRIGGKSGLLHHSAPTLTAYLEKQNRYTTLQAQALFAAGQKVGAARIVISPVMRFLKFYILRAGFLDGVPGLVHITIGCFNSLMKYAKLWVLWQQRP